MERTELETLIKEKVVNNEMPCGLYDTGLLLVHVFRDNVYGVCFTWHEYPEDIETYIDC